MCRPTPENYDLPPVIEHALIHHQQQYNWDCGISCIMMVLPLDKHQKFKSNFRVICKEEGFNQSTWTIDLCYLLKRYGISHIFYTVTLGINPGYHKETFYDEIIYKDAERVKKRFLEASENAVTVRQGSLSCQELVVHLAKFGPIILLTNGNLLHCQKCGTTISEFLTCLPCTSGFQGHYIVLSGYNSTVNIFYYHNPCYRDRMCTITFDDLDKSRLSYGTDEDAILIFLNSWTQ